MANLINCLGDGIVNNLMLVTFGQSHFMLRHTESTPYGCFGFRTTRSQPMFQFCERGGLDEDSDRLWKPVQDILGTVDINL